VKVLGLTKTSWLAAVLDWFGFADMHPPLVVYQNNKN
jgi:hypothetical protein